MPLDVVKGRWNVHPSGRGDPRERNQPPPPTTAPSPPKPLRVASVDVLLSAYVESWGSAKGTLSCADGPSLWARAPRYHLHARRMPPWQCFASPPVPFRDRSCH